MERPPVSMARMILDRVAATPDEDRVAIAVFAEDDYQVAKQRAHRAELPKVVRLDSKHPSRC